MRSSRSVPSGLGPWLSDHREWNTTPDFVNHSQAGNVFMLGAGGVIGESLGPITQSCGLTRG